MQCTLDGLVYCFFNIRILLLKLLTLKKTIFKLKEILFIFKTLTVYIISLNLKPNVFISIHCLKLLKLN